MLFSLRHWFIPVVRKNLGNLAHRENGEVNIVAIVVLIGVAIVLAVVFKNAAASLIKKLFEVLNGKAVSAWDDAV